MGVRRYIVGTGDYDEFRPGKNHKAEPPYCEAGAEIFIKASDYDALRGVTERLAQCLDGAMTRLERLEWKKSTAYSPSLEKEAEQTLAAANTVLKGEK